jgi:hypothetical protein
MKLHVGGCGEVRRTGHDAGRVEARTSSAGNKIHRSRTPPPPVAAAGRVVPGDGSPSSRLESRVRPSSVRPWHPSCPGCRAFGGSTSGPLRRTRIPVQYDIALPARPLPLLPMARVRPQTWSPDRDTASLWRAPVLSRVRGTPRGTADLADGAVRDPRRRRPRPRLPGMPAVLVRGATYAAVGPPAADAAADRRGACCRGAERSEDQHCRGRFGTCVNAGSASG